ncbi:MAG: isoprenyl transferase [Sulfobacillus thermosulfidooxidans]|uniref:Isoprenyl transferase n=1 Tax=Sulfobacillus thermotolerans TaxID=338644 RepID=A0ABM6RQX6_9FIRM|nr:isoprenyl transferase [Sulfobacillus thermotolerans]PSR37465.1 MAG: isoprenyl transferase [Sulfobacillus thermosulfidooxidans]
METEARHDALVNRQELIESGNVPRHIAIIMDGNGRWARQKGLTRAEGHRQGVKALKPIVKECAAIGVDVLTVYAFSTENWSRPQNEIDALMALLVEFLRSETEELKAEGVCIRTIGNISGLPELAQRAIQTAMAATAQQTRMVLNLALNYGGRDEIVRAINRWIQDNRSLTDNVLLTAPAMASYLDTAGLPDPDLLIRSSGEMRISNFLLWQLAYAEIYVTETLWPDFDPAELHKAIHAYQQRVRRFGGLRE